MQKILFILFVCLSASGSHVTKNRHREAPCVGLGRKQYAPGEIVGRLVKMHGGHVFIMPSIPECGKDCVIADKESEKDGDVGLPLEKFFSRDEE